MNTKQTHTAQQNLLFLALLQAEYAKQQNVTEQLLNILLLVVHATRLCKNDNCLPDRQNNAMHCFASDENCFSGMDASDENCCEFANANSIAQTAGTPFVRYEWGQRVYIQYGNGVETTYTYDENRRWLENIKTVSPDLLNPVLQNISYEFDKVGNVEGYKNDAGNYMTKQKYGYDDLYQLTSANGESEYIHNGLSNYRAQYSQTFSFDAQGLGNMLTKTSSASNNQGYRLGDEINYNLDYEYDSKFVHRAKRIGKQHYLYDLNGNLISEQEGAYNEAEASSQHEVIQTGNLYSVDYGWGIVNPDAAPTSTPNITRRNYTWNEHNLLKTSTDRSYSVQYKYGADGQRSAKYSVGSNGVSETLYFNKMYNWRYDSRIMPRDGRVSKHIYLGETRILTKLESAGNDLSAIVSEELTKQYYYHTDHLGSAQLISDHDGKEYERIEYTPYGELWIEKKTTISQIDIPFRFTGKERDEETGLYYYGARYLDAKTSRWLSTDSALGEYIPQAPINDEAKKRNGNLPGMGGVFNTVNSHLYHYAGNNPVKYIDPDGRITAVVEGNVRFHNTRNKKLQDYLQAFEATGRRVIPTWDPRDTAEGIDLIDSDAYIAEKATDFSEKHLGMEAGSQEQKSYVKQEQKLYKKLQSYRSQSENAMKYADKLLEKSKKAAEKKFHESRDAGLSVTESAKQGEAEGNKVLSDALDALKVEKNE